MISKKPMPKSIETKTEVKLSIPISHKISVGIMMLGAFIGFFAIIAGLTYELEYKYKVPSSSFRCEAISPGRCFYLSPNGNDSNNGLSTATAWATLGRADNPSTDPRPGMRAGDYLYIMGGDYPTSNTFVVTNVHAGTSESNRVTIKAYGDSQARMSSGSKVFDASGGGGHWFTIDGLVYGQTYLKFTATAPKRFIDLVDTDHFTVRGVELAGYNIAGNQYPFHVLSSDYLTLENSFIHDMWGSTGDEQDSPDCVLISGSSFFLIQNNKIERCNHGAINICRCCSMSYAGKNGKILNNVIDNHYGGGIYINENSEYNLVEGNIISHAGDSTTYPKPGLQLSGVNNTVRANVFYNPSDVAIDCDAGPGVISPSSCAYNLIYNNTIFGSGGGIGFRFYVKNTGAPDVVTEHNKFANNIVYKNRGTYGEKANVELALDLYHANEAHNWVDEQYPNEPNRTNYGGNIIQNNIIRDENASANPMDDQTIFFGQDAHVGGGTIKWSLNQLQNVTIYPLIGDPEAWLNNIGVDPMFISENPDDPEHVNDWWCLQDGSPAINAGVVVDDTNGAHVNTIQPGYGWSNLIYNGLPDIGACEYAWAQFQNTNINTSAANTNVNTNISVPVD